MGRAFWESLFDDLNESGHFFVSFSAENVTGKRKHARFGWYKAYVFDHPRFDIHLYVKLRQLESMMPVLTCQFQHNRHALLHRDLTWRKFESRSGDSNDLFVLSYVLWRGASQCFLVQITD